MKIKLVLAFWIGLACASPAQSAAPVFPELLSPTNGVLMTNAEFRCFSGGRIIFMNGTGYRTFQAGDLNTNVLAALHTDAARLEAGQKALDEVKRRQAAVDAAQRDAAARAQYAMDHPESSIYHDPHSKVRDPLQRNGNFFGQ